MGNGLVKDAKDLLVYKKSYSLALEIYKISLTLPKTEQYELASQVRRSSKSICANIKEGFAKQKLSAPEFRRFLLMAFGSAQEVETWLEFCFDLGYIDKENFDFLISEAVQVSKMLNALITNIRS